MCLFVKYRVSQEMPTMHHEPRSALIDYRKEKLIFHLLWDLQEAIWLFCNRFVIYSKPTSLYLRDTSGVVNEEIFNKDLYLCASIDNNQGMTEMYRAYGNLSPSFWYFCLGVFRIKTLNIIFVISGLCTILWGGRGNMEPVPRRVLRD